METMTRVWVNQPSKFQPDHKLHGRKALVNFKQKRKTSKGYIVRAWFLDYDIVSTEVFVSSLSIENLWQ